jgi:hypothetical protein
MPTSRFVQRAIVGGSFGGNWTGSGTIIDAAGVPQQRGDGNQQNGANKAGAHSLTLTDADFLDNLSSATDLSRKIRKNTFRLSPCRTIPLNLHRPQATDHGSRITETVHQWKSIRSQVSAHSHSGGPRRLL